MSNTRADEVTQPEEALILVVPMEIHVKNIATKLSLGDIAHLSNTCVQMYRFFKNTLDKEGANKLLRAVIHCDCDTIKKITLSNPELMFSSMDMDDFNGVALHHVSPLRYALYARSWYAINIFKQALTTPEQLEKFESHCKAYYPNQLMVGNMSTAISNDEVAALEPFLQLVNRWLIGQEDVTADVLKEFLLEQTVQLSSQDKCYSLRPIFWAYMIAKALIDNLRNGVNANLVTQEAVFAFLKNILNYAVRRLLPREMLHQMLACETGNGNYRWSVNASFADVEAPEYNAYIRDGNAGGHFYIPLFDADHPFELLDGPSVIWRGNSKEPCTGSGYVQNDEHFIEIESVVKDFFILRHLYNTRLSQFSLLCKRVIMQEPEERCSLM